jgi:type I restriction enzyme M protein
VGRAQNFLEKEHVERIYGWYRKFDDVENHVKVATLAEIVENDHNLNIPLYVEKVVEDDLPTVKEALSDLKTAWSECQKAEKHLKAKLREFGISV